MTWDDTNLYVAVSNAKNNEGIVVYLDTTNTLNPDAGTFMGSSSGLVYDSSRIASLPFAADLVVYARKNEDANGYRELRTPVPNDGGLNGWSASPNTTFGCYKFVGDGDAGVVNVREVVIPWSSVGGRPPSFSWL